MKNRNITIHGNRGFTLLEALIGFLILSIGMLGIASLQAISLKAGKTSVYNSVAMIKVDELVESMRANPTALVTYKSAGANNACTLAKKCSVVQLAEDDVYWWEQNLKAGMPASTVTTKVEVTTVGASKMSTVTVTVGWKERDKDSNGSADKSYSITANICTVIPC